MKATRSVHISCIRVARAHSGNRRRPVPEEAFRGLLLRCAPAVPSCGWGIPVPAKRYREGQIDAEPLMVVGHRAAWRGHRRL